MKKPSAIEEIIQQAMRRGDFDNLPGKGKPLELNPDEFTGDDWELAHHLLKENGFAPEFIEIRQSIEKDLEAARADLRRACDWRKGARERGDAPDWVESEFRKSQARFREQVDKLNIRIRDYNLTIPSDQFFRKSLNAPAMIKNIEDKS